MERIFQSNNNHSHRNSRRTNRPFFFKPYIYDKKIKKENHHKEIVDVFTNWKNKIFIYPIDFESFRLDSLKINIIEQIIPKQSNTELKTLNEMTLDHLNCKEYKNSFHKYTEINNLQNKFNNQINNFLDSIKENLRQFLTSNNVKFTDGQLNMLLRYYLYWIADKNRLLEEFDSRFANYRGKIIIDGEDIFNPFSKIGKETKSYIQLTADENKEKLNVFYEIINNITTLLKEFQDSLQLIIDNSVIGIKGKCKIENDLSLFRKIKCIFD